MTDANADLAISLVETDSFTKTVTFKIPGKAADTWREGQFKATFKLLSEKEADDLDAQDLSVRDYLREVILDVEGIPSATTKDGQSLTPKEVVIFNAFTSDAAMATYNLFTKENSFEKAHQAANRKNSKRSRAR